MTPTPPFTLDPHNPFLVKSLKRREVKSDGERIWMIQNLFTEEQCRQALTECETTPAVQRELKLRLNILERVRLWPLARPAAEVFAEERRGEQAGDC